MAAGNIGAGLRQLAGRRHARTLAVAATGTAAAAAVIGLAIPAGASPVAARPAAITGTEHFQSVTASVTSNTAPVIAWGPFAAGGTDHMSNSNAPTSTDLFTFPGGSSFKVTHTSKAMSQSDNAKTCFLEFTDKGTYKLSGGTGKYKGISGHGTFTVTGIGIAARTKKGACNPNANPVAFQEIISASGPVRLP